MSTPTPNPGIRGPFHCEVPKLLPAPPERVFRAWTDEAEAAQWLANGGRVILQPRIDGLFYIDMVYDAHTYPHYGRYLAVEPGRRLEFTWVSQGTEGKESIVEIRLEPHAAGTMLHLRHHGLPNEASADSHQGGWTEFVDILAGRF
jgi:uncharacterized protein YndB with AHSA1/START domain